MVKGKQRIKRSNKKDFITTYKIKANKIEKTTSNAYILNLPFPFSSIKFEDIFVSSSTSNTSFCCKPALLALNKNKFDFMY